MNPVAILYALSLSCFIVASCIAGWLLYDWQRLCRRLRDDADLDHWPKKTIRESPEWMRRNQINRKNP